ncbi:MAG: hypothetical protein BGO38_16645 [Cellulomonas sp. 73-145]|nr:MAG: hypothetical protein BGO38_16645 [Cellulomonas sp. 73-145]
MKIRPASWVVVNAGRQWSIASHCTQASAERASPSAAAASPSWTRPNAISIRPGGAVGSSARQAIFAAMVAAAAARSRVASVDGPTNAGSGSYHSGYSCEVWRCATFSGHSSQIHSAKVPSSATR